MLLFLAAETIFSYSVVSVHCGIEQQSCLGTALILKEGAQRDTFTAECPCMTVLILKDIILRN